jgi:hypothetical protein
MSRQEKLVTEDETTGLVDGPGAQTSNKAGLASSSRKPSNSGPDPHQEHVAPVDGAFGNEENREKDQRGQYAPADKAIKQRRES